ncbi:MAG: Na+/H+ antiporter NhaA [Anaerolineales bacterium]|nr:Na+/H+ antiporter NhaA [Anaerolineales bacterium]
MIRKHKLTKLFVEFLNSEQASGILLLFCTLISILIANSIFGKAFLHFWQIEVGFELGGLHLKHGLEYWVNDGLMTIFFLLIGLEIERELYIGELSDWKSASLPIFAALGGMAAPALFHFLFNHGSVTQSGTGIPVATDIAFALGALALLGKKVPVSLKIFLTALAIIDDLGAILIIALFYTSDFSLWYFLLAVGIYGGLLILNRRGVKGLAFYLVPGVVMWYFMLKSGVHATLAGVLLAFALPFENGAKDSTSYRLQHFLHKPVAFLIVPIFVFANTGIRLDSNWLAGLRASNSLGILAGLIFGKPLGIFGASFLAVKFGLSQLPAEIRWRQILGAGFLGGIGFTMSIFITLLAFNDPGLIQSSKISILLGSLCAGGVGYLILSRPISKVEASPEF